MVVVVVTVAVVVVVFVVVVDTDDDIRSVITKVFCTLSRIHHFFFLQNLEIFKFAQIGDFQSFPFFVVLLRAYTH